MVSKCAEFAKKNLKNVVFGDTGLGLGVGLGLGLGIWGEKSVKKRLVHSGPKDASSAYLFFIRVRVRLTKLVYQIGLTTFFRSQGLENVLAAAAAAAAASSKQAASN